MQSVLPLRIGYIIEDTLCCELKSRPAIAEIVDDQLRNYKAKAHCQNRIHPVADSFYDGRAVRYGGVGQGGFANGRLADCLGRQAER